VSRHAVIVDEERYYSRMKRRMKYPIENIPYPTQGTLLTRAKRAAVMDAALASMAAEGLLVGWRFTDRLALKASKTAKKR